MKQFLFITALFSCFLVRAQQTHLVFLKDKGNLSGQKPISLTERALSRRAKNNVSIDWNDLPVSSVYIKLLQESGNVLSSSRWLNAICLKSDLSANQLMEKYEFIDRIESIQAYKNDKISKEKLENSIEKTLNYGWTDTQVRQINLPCIHDQGYKGDGVFLAVIDAGFNGMDTIPFFNNVYLQNRIIDEFDFVGGNSVYNYSGHGTAVSSCIVGEMTGANQFIGTAPEVDLALYVTEDVSSETQLEEYNLVLALERCDSIGVDVVNISLGYVNFDDSTTNYSYSDMDGHTTIAAQGAMVAASKGIIVVTSAGNGGPEKISTPCDADSILCVGAVDGLGNYASFSSVGPSYDGRVKPDVVARGAKPWVVWQNGDLIQSNGTSFSSPILAGATACLVQANPSKTAQEIIQSIRESAHQFANPDSLLGYGIPNFCEPFASLVAIDNPMLQVYPNPTTTSFKISGLKVGETTVSIVNQMGQKVYELHEKASNSAIEINCSLPVGIYSIIIENDAQVSRLKLVITD